MVNRICVKCNFEKELTRFRKLKKWYSHTCKECYAAQYRTGKPNLGRFKKGNIPKKPFEKGHKLGIGRKLSPEQIEKTASKLRGRKLNIEHRNKISVALKNSIIKCRNGKSRRSRLSIEWSLKVRERDENKCKHCLKTENLHAHHIIPWRLNEDLRYEINNGITLCKSCHAIEERKHFPITPWALGKKFSQEHRQKLSIARKGKIPWNKKVL